MAWFISLPTADWLLDSWYWTLCSLWKDGISRLLQWYCFGSSLCIDHCRRHHVHPGIHWMYWRFKGKYLPTEIRMLSCLIILVQVYLNFLIVSSFSSLQKDCGCSRKCQDYWHFHPFERSLTTGHEFMLPLSSLQFALLVTLPLATTKKTVRMGGLINNVFFPEHNPLDTPPILLTVTVNFFEFCVHSD